MLCLTYDDGPSDDLTPRVLGALSGASARATFFLLGRCAEQRPNVVAQIAAAGHEIGCHSYAHLNAWKCNPWRVSADIERGYQCLSRWTKADATFRPPYGKYTPFSWLQVRRRGARLVRWTHDSGDTSHGPLPSVDAVVNRVSQDGGGMVLLHDFDRQGDPTKALERANFVLDVTRSLLVVAGQRRWPIVTVSEFLQRRASQNP
jgi:peptidoglycan/xylan/chitin deacetylase (PgdA/CDA1 family)